VTGTSDTKQVRHARYTAFDLTDIALTDVALDNALDCALENAHDFALNIAFDVALMTDFAHLVGFALKF
jgi:hypothetical protein